MGMNEASRTVLTEALFVHLILICCKQTIVSIGLFDAHCLNLGVNLIEIDDARIRFDKLSGNSPLSGSSMTLLASFFQRPTEVTSLA